MVNHKLTVSLRLIPLILSLFVFIPLYFDLSKPLSGFIWLDENTVDQLMGIPIPIGALAIGLLILSCSLFPSLRSTSTNLIQSKRLLFFALLTLLIPFYLFASSLSFVRTLQLLSPLIMLILVRVPASIEHLLKIIFSACAGLLIFQLFHIVYILLDGSLIESVNISFSNNYAFVRFYGSVIYSGLVSYPAVIGLCIVVSLVAIHIISNPTFYKLSRVNAVYKSKLFYFIVLGVQIFNLSFLSRKASFFEAAFVFVCVSFVLLEKAFRNRVSKSSLAVAGSLLIVGFLVFAFELPIAQRLLLQSGSVGDDRIDKYFLFADLFFSEKSTLSIFLFGLGGQDQPGLHNFFLDTFFRVGLLGLLPLVLALATCILQPIILVFLAKPPRRMLLHVASYLLIASIFVGNAVNTQVTQLIYASSLVFSLLCFGAIGSYSINICW